MASRRATRSNPPLKGLGTMQAPFQVLAATAWLLSAFGLANAVAPTRTFAFSSGVDAIDAAYELALREMSGLSGARHGKGGHFLAGAGWPSLWTRDTSYAVELSAGLVFPKISEESLRKCGMRGVWMQDSCAHFGGWPYLSDAIVGARGAWSLYLVTGDVEFLRWAYGVTVKSLALAERDVFDEKSGLFKGCSSFMESNSGYPEKYRNKGRLVGQTKALSTNLLHHSGYVLGAKMGGIVGAEKSDIDHLRAKGRKLRDAIHTRLWNETRGNYAYFEDENGHLVEQNEGLGLGLLLTDPEFAEDDDRIRRLFNTTHRTPRGLPCLWPQFKHKHLWGVFDLYHNGRIWPFVQGYWAVAAASHNRVDVFEEEFRNLLLLSQSPDPTFAEFYELDGTFPRDRRRQLWSDTGFLGMIYRGLFGMTFQPDGIAFNPVKPHGLFGDAVTLKNVPYRNMTLDISVRGSGAHVASFTLDNQPAVVSGEDAFIKSDLQGKHTISIVMKDPNVNVAQQHPEVAYLDGEDALSILISNWLYFLMFVAIIPVLLFWGSWSMLVLRKLNVCLEIEFRWGKTHKPRGSPPPRTSKKDQLSNSTTCDGIENGVNLRQRMAVSSTAE